MQPLSPSVTGFLSAGRVGHLGTADASGQPLVVPICYAWDGRHLYSALDAKPKSTGAMQLKRIRNIRDNPKVSVVIDHYDEDWTRLRWVILRGRAEVLTAGADFSRGVDLLLAKYPQYRAMGLARETGVLIRVTPDGVSEWQFSS
ncbi:MAG TPA: TIGR03668 family PPOX class F420-dependent oxidoreductase [Methylomirabilota bacterium]|nr:TIGR03668 family PPOX class F420-dependent oxidoreductase [Methylomirabilota bacterium]